MLLRCRPPSRARLDETRRTDIHARLRPVEQRNNRCFDDEVLKLDHWSDNLKAHGFGVKFDDLSRYQIGSVPARFRKLIGSTGLPG